MSRGTKLEDYGPESVLLIMGGKAGIELFSEAASPNRRCSQRGLEILTSRRSEARPRS